MTHNERVLGLLSDGEPHSHHEGYGLHVMLHSRVADLRKQGHDIACWREGDSYFYRLLRTAAGSGSSAAVRSGSEPSPQMHDPLPGAGNSGLRTPAPVQLLLKVNA